MRAKNGQNLIKLGGTAANATVAATFISSALLSTVCVIFYNIWLYDAQRGTVKTELSLLVLLYIFVMLAACVSLVLIIKNAFAVSFAARVRDIGTISGIGAAPKQIRSMLIGSALRLTFVPILAGCASGVGLGYLFVLFTTQISLDPANFGYSAWVAAASILSCVLTVLISAWLPARKAGLISPLAAVRYTGEAVTVKKRRPGILKALFGFEGELASYSIKARRKSLRSISISLTLSTLAFTVFACFITISSISTEATYFERYKDRWDVMVEMSEIPDSGALSQISQIEGVESAVLYYKSFCKAELRAGEYVKTPLIVMDEAGFDEYLKLINAPQTSGAVVFDRIWDGGDFRNKRYSTYTDGTKNEISFENGNVFPVVCYTQTEPILREELDYSIPTLILPMGLYTGEAPGKCFIRVLASDKNDLTGVEESVKNILNGRYSAAVENRIGEKAQNDKVLSGYMTFVGALCSILALIGVANVFTNSIGMAVQRKREFARYMSVGVTDKGIGKILAAEALYTVGRPFLAALVLTFAFVIFAVNASRIELGAFMSRAPVAAIGGFFLAIVFFVALAYAIGARGLSRINISQALKNEALL